jgi:small-conductance mechanosensitive channel
MSDIALPGRTTSLRASVVSFALLGGGTTSVVCGLIAGVIAWAVMPAEVVPFPSSDRFSVYTSGERLMIWPFALTLFVAPFMFLVFGFAASAQVIAESMRERPSQGAGASTTRVHE